MRATDPLPRPVGWLTRTIFWGIGIAIVLGILYGYGNARLATHVQECLNSPAPRGGDIKVSALVAAQRRAACIHQHSGMIERVILYRTRRMLLALPATPCRFIGVWRAQRTKTEYQVTLRDDSGFSAVPVKAPRGSGPVTGSWGYYGGKLVWLYEEGLVFPPDVNRIEDAKDTSFTLVEKDGSTTRYALLERTQSSACSP
jgi:hypothetical protein